MSELVVFLLTAAAFVVATVAVIVVVAVAWNVVAFVVKFVISGDGGERQAAVVGIAVGVVAGLPAVVFDILGNL